MRLDPRYLACVLAALVSAPASAQDLTTNDFRVDLTRGPVLGSGRVIGLAGAMTALAEGVAAAPFNAAAYASRARWELDRFEWEPAFSLLLGGSYRENDFFLNGRGEGFGVDDFTFFDVGLRFQLGDVGFGVLVQTQRYGLPDADTTDALVDANARFRTAHAGLGYGLFRGQLVLGAGLRIVTLRFDARAVESGASEVLLDFQGAGLDVGMVLRPDGRSFRVGAALRSAVLSEALVEASDEVQTVLGLPLPETVSLPWEARAGFAWQFGPRRFNPRHVRPKDVHRSVSTAPGGASPLARERAERYADPGLAGLRALAAHIRDGEPRRYGLVSGEIFLQGAVANAVGIDAFLRQESRARGRRTSVGFRLGVEGEPWDDRLQLRAGTYLEPARYAGERPRIHGTAGFDVRLFRLWRFDLRAGFTIDGARDYLNWGVGIGVWH
ncbi:MAG: hypothetical protein AAF447_25735 [Myxococcota bacterium]